MSTSSAATPAPAITHTVLDNGLEVVVIPDHRAPVVTHMVWYRNGGADDPVGKSGIAHFLEHLMFKGTEKHKAGEFSEVISDLGGQENAFTSQDYTAYFQRIAKEHLGTMMEFEADRMANLVLTDEVVAPERDVVLEERRMRYDSDPAQQLGEIVWKSLFSHHPYGTPVIGWEHEIETLGREDALAYYRRFYTPENAILVVSGDVTPDEVVRLASATYGKLPRRNEAPARWRPREPRPIAAKLVRLADAKVEQPHLQRVFLVPSYRGAEPGEAEALEVMSHLLGAPMTGWLYRHLVVGQGVSVNAGAWYMGDALDETRFAAYAVPAGDLPLPELDRILDEAIEAFKRAPPGERELARAKTRLVADAIYSRDSQSSMARIYGAALAIGGTIEDVESWPSRIEAVTGEAVIAVAKKYLDRDKSVTGYLEKPAGAPEGPSPDGAPTELAA